VICCFVSDALSLRLCCLTCPEKISRRASQFQDDPRRSFPSIAESILDESTRFNISLSILTGWVRHASALLHRYTSN
jgi:hypothetical protein